MGLPLLGTDPDTFPPVCSALEQPNGLLAAGGKALDRHQYICSLFHAVFTNTLINSRAMDSPSRPSSLISSSCPPCWMN